MQGNGKMLVTCVGEHSQTGQILRLMAEQNKDHDGSLVVKAKKSVLKEKLETLATLLGYFGKF